MGSMLMEVMAAFGDELSYIQDRYDCEAYQTERLFAVRPEDYGRQSERLDWVQRARGTCRWTGSWHSVLVAADPLDAHQMSDEQISALMDHLDCARQAGRDVKVYQPQYLDVDLEIIICVEPFAYPAEVKAQLLERLTEMIHH